MFGIHDFWLFLAAGFLLNVTPGPDTAYVVGRSVQLGWRGGGGGRARHRHRVPRPYPCSRDRPVGAAGGLLGRVCADQADRCGLPLLHRHPDAADACGQRGSAGGCGPGRQQPAPGVLAGRLDQRPQPGRWRCSSWLSCRSSSMRRRRPRRWRSWCSACCSMSPAPPGDLGVAVVAARAASRSSSRGRSWSGSTARSAACSSISACASPCCSNAERTTVQLAACALCSSIRVFPAR